MEIKLVFIIKTLQKIKITQTASSSPEFHALIDFLKLQYKLIFRLMVLVFTAFNVLEFFY